MKKGDRKVFIIGLVGLPGAGKTTVAKYLEKKGYKRITLSDFIKEAVKKEGIKEFSRELLQDFGNKLRREFGPQVLAQLALKKIRAEGYVRVVIDGVRNLYEAAYLRTENNFKLIGIIADSKIRYQRLLKKRGRDWMGTYNNFLSQESREEHLGSRELGLRVSECLDLAEYRIINDKEIPELYQAVEALLKKLKLET